MTIKHAKVSAIPDDPDDELVRSSDWNADHVGAELSDLSDVDLTGVTVNKVLKYDGTKFVVADYNESFSFSIASFTTTLGTSPQEIGVGTWKAIGAGSFSASYNNGPATGGYVIMSGTGNTWASNLSLTNIFQGPTNTVEIINHRGTIGAITFTLNATDGSINPTSIITINFWNKRFWGTSTKDGEYIEGEYTEADIEGLADNELSNSKSKTFTVTSNIGEYIIFSYPSRLGTATFTVGGFEGGFINFGTISVTNASGFTENYRIYRSANSGLGTTTVVAT